ncbi:MAG: hypothetical protein U5O12_04545 [Rhodoferax sp.]|nr:hypothetical protein [Rhodoferax sp.]
MIVGFVPWQVPVVREVPLKQALSLQKSISTAMEKAWVLATLWSNLSMRK